MESILLVNRTAPGVERNGLTHVALENESVTLASRDRMESDERGCIAGRTDEASFIEGPEPCATQRIATCRLVVKKHVGRQEDYL